MQVDIVPREERDEGLRPGGSMSMPGPMGYWPPGQPGPMGSEEAQPSMSVQAQQPQQFPQVLPSMGPRPGMQMDPSVMQVVHLSVGCHLNEFVWRCILAAGIRCYRARL